MSTAVAGSLPEALLHVLPTLSIGMLTADLGHLQDQLDLIEQEGARIVHIDVMDGVLVPQLTFGAPLVRAIGGGLLKDVHLMIQDPLPKLAPFLLAGPTILTFHVESTNQPLRVLQAMRESDAGGTIARGIALMPSTPAGAIVPLLDEVDYVLVLAVNPGWSGQAFVGSTPGRVAAVRELIAASGRQILLGIDGGVTRDNIGDVLALGADIVVTGSAVFDGRDPAANARHMLAAAPSAATGA